MKDKELREVYRQNREIDQGLHKELLKDVRELDRELSDVKLTTELNKVDYQYLTGLVESILKYFNLERIEHPHLFKLQEKEKSH